MSAIIANTEFEVSTSTNAWNNSMYNFLHAYDNRITLDSNNYIRFDNKFSIRFKDTTDADIYLIRDGASEIDTTGDFGYWTNGSYAIVTLIKNNNIFYVKICKKNNTTDSGGVFMWIKQDDRDFFGAIAHLNDSSKYVDDITFYDCVNTLAAPYTFKKVADYVVQTPKIAFASKTPFIDTVGSAIQIDNLASSSTVSLGSTVTVGGKNYHAIGTNILIPVD